MKTILSLAMIAALAAPARARARPPPPTAAAPPIAISGRVVADVTGDPIPTARVPDTRAADAGSDADRR